MDFLKDLTLVEFDECMIKVRPAKPEEKRKALSMGVILPDMVPIKLTRTLPSGVKYSYELKAEPETILNDGSEIARAYICRWRPSRVGMMIKEKMDVKPIDLDVNELKEVFRQNGWLICGEDPEADRSNWTEKAVKEGWFTAMRLVNNPKAMADLDSIIEDTTTPF